MKTIFRIAKTELRYLFYSPIAWFIMIVFLIQCAVTYTGQLEYIAKIQEMGGDLSWIRSLTASVFLGPRGLFTGVIENLYLYIPLLTMGLISRETSSGTIKLLYSSPVQVHEIVFGKFLAMMIYSLLLVGIVGIFIASGSIQIQSAETGMLLTGALGFFLLLCAYSAVGLFMSSLTTYQVVAAVCTFLMIGILYYVGRLWQGIDFIRELTYFLSIAGRTEKMLNGLLTTKDVIYFVVIVYIFLGLTIFKLKGGMESKPVVLKSARYIGVIISALIIGYVSSIPSLIGYYDSTSNKARTLTVGAQKILKNMGDEPLEITAYPNLLSRFWYLGDFTTYNYNLARWEPYMRFKNNIIINTVRYYDTPFDDPTTLTPYPGKSLREVATIHAKFSDTKIARLKTPEEIKKIIDLKPELNRYVMQLKYKGKTTFLRVFNDQETWPSETEVSAALLRLLPTKMPKIAFLTGNLERDINKVGEREYKILNNERTFRYSLMNQGFDVTEVSLENQDIPASVTTLVIADPKIEFDPDALIKLQNYIDKGGNLLIAGEPGKQNIINPVLKKLGVQLMDGTLIQQSKDFAPNLITPYLTKFAGGFSKAVAKNMKDSLIVSMPGTAGLSYSNESGFDIQPLLVTNGKLTWNRKRKLDLETMTSADTSAAQEKTQVPQEQGDNTNSDLAERRKKALAIGRITYSPAEGDLRGPITTVVSLTRKINGKEQRIIVAGDADFLSNSELQRNNMRTGNFVFNTSLFSWLNYGEFPIDSTRPDVKDKSVKVSIEQVGMLKILYIYAMPAVLFLFGLILLLRRKRK
ncbi:Gldg family protein [Pedobacter miscanthi]|uniref:Gldg family protein n=1 Tax=Pedobacter miscanthi TaxID=2259170 RepID=UPI0029302835|nr:Gldg family protein [Pedobacter miscanthi]